MKRVKLRDQVENWIKSTDANLEVDRGSAKVQQVLNWGGFVTSSFHVSDGQRTLHLKLGRPAEQARMRRWMTVHEMLEQRYHAPRILGWVDLPESGYGGLMFEHIDGKLWDVDSNPTLLKEMVSLLRTLHRDPMVVEALGDPQRSYRDCWEMRYREQFEEDLRTVRSSRPPFVSESVLAWMQDESQKVLALGYEHWALAGMTKSACHWDLWPDNVMLQECGKWWVLDWDGVAVGDDAEDYATVAWPVVSTGRKQWRDAIGEEPDEAFACRMELHLRAISLDYTIDVLADWVDCDVAEWMDEVRHRKQEEHSRFLDMYRTRWG